MSPLPRGRVIAGCPEKVSGCKKAGPPVDSAQGGGPASKLGSANKSYRLISRPISG